MTERLYYTDSYLTSFRATVVDADPEHRRIYLDRTAFYPSSGGQPHDLGAINGVPVVDVVDEEDGRIAHLLERPLDGVEADCAIDWDRRFDHMQQHTGQHLLSAVLLDMFGAQTLSFHLGAQTATIDIERETLDADDVRRATERANRIVFESRLVTVTFRHSSEDLGLRKPTEREGTVRIIGIEGLDLSACGGTHVRATGEIGPILIRRIEKVRGGARVEFVCGMRAVRRAHADYEALSGIARSFSAAIDDTAGLVRSTLDKLQEADKARRKLSLELAHARGRELYHGTAAGLDGLRRVRRTAPSISDELRAEAQAFASAPGALFLAVVEDPPSLLLAVSNDSRINAGQAVQQAVTAAGGRGGGTPTVAQGRVPTLEALNRIAADLVP